MHSPKLSTNSKRLRNCIAASVADAGLAGIRFGKVGASSSSRPTERAHRRPHEQSTPCQIYQGRQSRRDSLLECSANGNVPTLRLRDNDDPRTFNNLTYLVTDDQAAARSEAGFVPYISLSECKIPPERTTEDACFIVEDRSGSTAL